MSDNRSSWFLGFILLALGSVVLLESSFPVILVLLGLLFLVRQFDNEGSSNLSSSSSEARQSSYSYGDEEAYEEDYDDYEIFHQQPASAEQRVYRHALESAIQAGQDPDDVQVLPVDIGILVTKGDEKLQIYRTWTLPDDIDYIQPFVVLRMPEDAEGDICFEIADALGNLVYSREDTFQLKRGRNLLTPQTRMPLHDQMQVHGGNWTLRVIANDMPIAIHRFEYAETSSASIRRRHIGEDGEINIEARAALADSRPAAMSLDDLLAYQDEEDAAERRS